MKRNEEKEYFAYLEKIIREQKARSGFWHRSTSSYEMDILILMNHIAKKNPHLADRIVDNFVDTTRMKDCSKQDILAFMGRTEKGTICKWRNENGEEIYLVNNGENFFKKSKQILVFGNHVNRGDIELLRKSMYGAVLKKDIQKVYEKISREEHKKMRRVDSPLFSILDSMAERREKITEHTASDFEKNFKRLVREQGSICIPRATADTMLAFMSRSEIHKLGHGLNSIGVRNELDWERLLSKWKEEALNPNITLERTYKRTVKPRSVDVLHLR